MKIVFAAVLAVLAQSSFALDVVYRDPSTVDLSWTVPGRELYFHRVETEKKLRAYCEAAGVKLGMFPCLLDLDSKTWVPIDSGAVSAVSDLDARILFLSGDSEALKSPSLKSAENKLIEFLRTEGAIAAGAVSATADQIDAMVANWEATLNDSQLDKKSTKYDRLLRAVERRGGTESGARYH